jgi:hypothetical protein
MKVTYPALELAHIKRLEAAESGPMVHEVVKVIDEVPTLMSSALLSISVIEQWGPR